MKHIFKKKNLVLLAVVTALLSPVEQVFAATPNLLFNQVPIVSQSADATNQSTTSYASIKSVGKTFAMIDETGYLQVNQEARDDSAVVGKVYQDSLLEIQERSEEWTKISSGNVVGYIRTEKLVSESAALVHAKALAEKQNPLMNVSTMDTEVIFANLPVGETVEEETARLAAEEAARIAAEEAARRAKGQAVVDYAKQFLGNPYVYGGTSLTRGTDCSGFVLSVYAKFGFSLPHSSYGQRSVGRRVSYSEIQPGDIICYPGHVGIYAGDGKIIHASDERSGIKFSNARYTRIVSIRRMF